MSDRYFVTVHTPGLLPAFCYVVPVAKRAFSLSTVLYETPQVLMYRIETRITPPIRYCLISQKESPNHYVTWKYCVSSSTEKYVSEYSWMRTSIALGPTCYLEDLRLTPTCDLGTSIQGSPFIHPSMQSIRRRTILEHTGTSHRASMSSNTSKHVGAKQSTYLVCAKSQSQLQSQAVAVALALAHVVHLTSR